jgi:acetone carboxylase gamma subunit
MDNMNAQIKKNAISFDIDFENIKQNTLTTKQDTKQPKKVEVIPNEEDPNEANKEQTLYKCPNCGRTFKREAYAKHVPVCARVFNNKIHAENNKNTKDKEKDKKIEKKGFNKKSKWENQSDELRAIIQSKRAEKGKYILFLFIFIIIFR